MKRGFRPSLREQMRQSLAAQKWLAAGAPDEKKEIAAAHIAGMEAGQLPPVRTRAAPRQLEAPVVAAIAELLAVHPKVLFAVRQNSGGASYQAKSGKYAPVFFYRILTKQPMTITDFWGILKDGRMLAIEAKAPGFSEPRADTEYRQAAFLAMVRNCGGIGLFATSADRVAEALRDA